jgi:hypothetical protein
MWFEAHHKALGRGNMRLWMITNHYAKKHIFFLATILLTTTASAWNYDAHVLIGQIAYDNLSPKLQKIVDADAKALLEHFPEQATAEINKYYPDPKISSFAKTMVLADQFKMLKVFKRTPLIKILLTLNIAPPKALQPYLQETTSSWHFFDVLVSTNTAIFQCHFIIPQRSVLWAIDLLERAAREHNSPDQQGLIFALLGHFVGDAHQPLHLLNSFDKNCQGDLGGNTFCLKPLSSDGYCKKSLHALWDEALGYTAYDRISKTPIPILAKELEKEFPLSSMIISVNQLNTKDWPVESMQYAPFIYNTPPGLDPSEDYYRTGRLIAKQKITLAGYRLAKIIEALLVSRH